MKRFFLLLFAVFLSGCSKPEQKPFVILICSYNNAAYYEENLTGALNQRYENYRVIYVNDVSTDGTGEGVEKLIATHPKGERVTLFNNNERCGALKNIYTSIHGHIKDNEIVVLLDGDDFLADEDVLTHLNEVYSTQDVWMTYGQMREKNSGMEGFCKPMPVEIVNQNSFRQHLEIPSHLRTFYAGLFKKIKKEDLLFNGQFYPMTWDMAMMLPMIEMARDHFTFIPRVLYIYNDDNPISDFRKSKHFQRALDLYIRGLTPYQPLESL
ncbi:MAG: glycosyltransferase family 2 protein [Simkaniaceae bacterium]|nr:glycosyltransferase family 2 protein [Simkaniaceae bacterium]